MGSVGNWGSSIQYFLSNAASAQFFIPQVNQFHSFSVPFLASSHSPVAKAVGETLQKFIKIAEPNA